MAGVDLNTVRELLGHKSPSMTLRYLHLSLDPKGRGVKLLNSRIGTMLEQSAEIQNIAQSQDDFDLIVIPLKVAS